MTGTVRRDLKRGLSVEFGTLGVPADGRYHVIDNGGIVLSTGVEALAVAEFDEMVERRREDELEPLKNERAARDVRDFRAQSYAEKSARDRAKGGRGIGRR